jgi:hypothetical protein
MSGGGGGRGYRVEIEGGEEEGVMCNKKRIRLEKELEEKIRSRGIQDRKGSRKK